MKSVGNSSDGRSQGVPKISGHPCIGRMGALRGHLCDSTTFLFSISAALFPSRSVASVQFRRRPSVLRRQTFICRAQCTRLAPTDFEIEFPMNALFSQPPETMRLY